MSRGVAAARRFSHTVGFDDAPFARDHRGDVPVVGAVFAAERLEGVLCGKVRRDGANSTRVLAHLVTGSRFAGQLQLVLLQGIALAGFNVVDARGLAALTGLPVLVVARRQPRLERVRRALLARVPSGERKWRLVEGLGPMEALAGVWVQRVGLSSAEAERVLRGLALHSHLPEPLRVAHLMAGALARGESRGRV